MKEKILTLITGALLGATIASAGFLIHSKINNKNIGNVPQMNQTQMQNGNGGMTPPSIRQEQNNNMPSQIGNTNNTSNNPQTQNNNEKPNMNENNSQNASKPNNKPQENGGPQGGNGQNGSPQGNKQNHGSKPNMPGGNNSQNGNGNAPSTPNENSAQ